MSEFELTPFSPNGRRADFVDDPVRVEARLHSLHPDLSARLLRDAIMGGLSGRNDVTRASAPTAAGVQQWLKTVEDLRTLLVAGRWHIHEQKNCPFITSPDRLLSIVVMTGNSDTGWEGSEDPTNQAEKGAVAEGYIQKNRQLELFNQESLKLARDNNKETQVWALLYHYDKVQNEVRYELSLPTGFGKKKITAWGERIGLGRIPNNPSSFDIISEEPNAPVSVEVAPKPGTF